MGKNEEEWKRRITAYKKCCQKTHIEKRRLDLHPIRKKGYLIPISNANLEFYNESIPEQTGSKEVLTVSEAAEILRISKPCMYELVESGEIRSVKVGRRILISRTSLMEFISGKATTTK